MDANEYALKVGPAAKSLGVAIRSAQWLGRGAAKPVTTVPAALERRRRPQAARRHWQREQARAKGRLKRRRLKSRAAERWRKSLRR